MAISYPVIKRELYYPESDGLPTAETDFQLRPLLYAAEALDLYFEAQPVYVSGNILMYYEEGRPDLSVAPDVLVSFGIPKGLRRTYKIWEEGKAPDFILEITSKSTRAVDQGPKRGLYAFLGVTEYFQYDPTGDYLRPPLQGWRLNGADYAAVPIQSLNGTLTVYSETLGLTLRAILGQHEFRFYNPKTGQRLLSRKEAEQARLVAEQDATTEADARRLAEARAIEAEARAADAEARMAEEAETRRALEVEVARLRAQLTRRTDEA